mgnify:CR=1 FL=1
MISINFKSTLEPASRLIPSSPPESPPAPSLSSLAEVHPARSLFLTAPPQFPPLLSLFLQPSPPVEIPMAATIPQIASVLTTPSV